LYYLCFIDVVAILLFDVFQLSTPGSSHAPFFKNKCLSIKHGLSIQLLLNLMLEKSCDCHVTCWSGHMAMLSTCLQHLTHYCDPCVNIMPHYAPLLTGVHCCQWNSESLRSKFTLWCSGIDHKVPGWISVEFVLVSAMSL